MKNLIPLFLIFLTSYPASGKEYILSSPDRKTALHISVHNGISMRVNYQSQALFSVENMYLDVEGQHGKDAFKKVTSKQSNSVNQTIFPEIKEKYGEIQDQFNELTLDFSSNYSITIRAYNNGIAYRFSTAFGEDVVINEEQLTLRLADKDSIYLQKSKSFNSSYETPYEHSAVKEVTGEGYACLPLLVQTAKGMNIVVAESDLVNYPGMWLKGTGTATLKSVHPGYPVSFNREGSPYAQGQVKEHAAYIARVEGTRTYPWRIFALAEKDADLLSNTLVYQLASPSEIEDVSWIQPGVVAFDWWGRRNIYGVDFKSGINTETAKYFIDFCADFGFAYFLFDDGWSKQENLLDIHPDLDMEEVMAYARKKEVKVMVWAIWNTFAQQEEEAWKLFEKWGIHGIKFDFMNRDDQLMVQFYHHVAREAAKRKMVIDFHGAYKPAGLRRTYPNVLTREALIEFEYNGWTKHDTPAHHNLLPYIRMVTGPMDYIPYTTQNATRKNFRPVGDRPMGQGTRAHSMALFLILESPMQMLPDSPSDYYRERECTEFFAGLPTEWEDLKVLHASIGEYTVLARKHGEDWYIGAITDWTARSFELKLDFLDDASYTLECFGDGKNADTRAIDYIRSSETVSSSESLHIDLAPGGGWLAKVSRVH